MGRCRLAAALVVLALPLAAAAAEPPSCAVPPDLTQANAGLPAWSAAVLERPAVLRIVALGSGTTEGIGSSSPAASYPVRLEVALSERLGQGVTVVNQGIQRQTASDMLARLDRDVLVHKPRLVLWETGTVDAVRGVPLDDFTQLLEDGVARIRQAGADVLLIDPQYARYTPRMVNLLPFVEAIRTVAASHDALLFDRFEVMRYWIDNDLFHLDERERATRATPRLVGSEIDQLYDCIARRLADTILNAAPQTKPSAAK